jgi:hypothetical protein
LKLQNFLARVDVLHDVRFESLQATF